MHNNGWHEQKWVLLLTGSLVLSLVAFAWLTRKPLCFESEAVRAIRWSLGPGSDDVLRCRSRKFIGYNEELAAELPRLGERLGLLDTFGAYYLPELWSKAKIVVRVEEDDRQDLEPVSADEVVVRESELNETGLLEARILGAVIDDRVAKERWPKSPSVELLKTYLGSLAGFDDAKADLGDWKLSLYSEAVKRARQGLGFSKQKEIFQEWKTSFLGGNAKGWEMPAALLSPMHESLALFGYRQSKKLFQVPFAVYFADRAIALSPDEKKRLHRQLAAVIYPDRALFPFANREYPRGELEPIQVGRLVLFQCGIPKMEDLDFMGLEFEHLLFIQSCDKPNLDMVVSALRSPRMFATTYPDVDFVQTHLPSLRLALDRSGAPSREIVSLLSSSSQSTLHKLGLLSEITTDPASGTRSWKGAVEPLPLFRLQHVKLPAVQ